LLDGLAPSERLTAETGRHMGNGGHPGTMPDPARRPRAYPQPRNVPEMWSSGW
jgi:hypothetical protein